MTPEQRTEDSNLVTVNRGLTIPASQELGVGIEKRQYDRLVERLRGCRPSGWSAAWLAIAGAGAGVAGAAGVGGLTLPPALSPGIRSSLWMLTGVGVVVFALCLAFYFTQRNADADVIDELLKDMELHQGTTTSVPSPRPSAD